LKQNGDSTVSFCTEGLSGGTTAAASLTHGKHEDTFVAAHPEAASQP
jgi:hypothetical protein